MFWCFGWLGMIEGEGDGCGNGNDGFIQMLCGDSPQKVGGISYWCLRFRDIVNLFKYPVFMAYFV